MATMILFKSFFDYTIDSFSTEQTNFPASNLKIYEKQYQYWKASGTADTWVILDFTTAQSINGVALFNVNFSQYRIQGDTTTSFASPPYDSGLITVSEDLMRRRYNSFQNPQSFASFNYRYMRIFIPTGSTTDGDAVFKLGSLIVSVSANQLNRNPAWGFNVRPQRAESLLPMRSGQDEVLTKGERFVEIDFNMQRDRNATEYDEAGNLIFSIDKSTPVVFNPNGDFLENADNSKFTYLLKRTSDPTYSFDNVNIAEISGITLKEKIN